jgi:hypothetical protein
MRGSRACYQSGKPFRPWHVANNFLSARHVSRMIRGKDEYYYSGGAFGSAWTATGPWCGSWG